MFDKGTDGKSVKVGIDGIGLGTTNTVVSYIDDEGEIKHVLRIAGSTAIPSVIIAFIR